MFGHCAAMRIDASNLLLAAQAQAQRPAAAKAPAPLNAFETLDFAKPAGGEDRKQTALPGGMSRPGMQLDIKV
jgi:hypothetical protein